MSKVNTPQNTIGVVIAAAGTGQRLGGKTPKQFLKIKKKTVLEYSVRAFAKVREVQEIVVVAPMDLIKRAEEIIEAIPFKGTKTVVAGGRERQDSVRIGLHAFSVHPDFVLVHDAARPLIEPDVIRKVIVELREYPAAVVGVKVKDTVKVEGQPGFFTSTLDRKRLWTVQTPQGFHFNVLLDAHRKAKEESFLGTDEASLVERLALPVRIVEGDKRNVKVTTQDDLDIVAEWIG